MNSIHLLVWKKKIVILIPQYSGASIKEGDIVKSTDDSNYDFKGLPVITVDGYEALIKLPVINETRWIPFNQLIKMNS